MPPFTAPTLTATICTLEHRAWTALCESGSALLPLLSSNPVMIFPGDNLFTGTSSPTVHDMLRDPAFRPWKSYSLSHDKSLRWATAAPWYTIVWRRLGTTPRFGLSALALGCRKMGSGRWRATSRR